MLNECHKCGEHCLECSCNRKSFDQLVAEKAGCFEFAFNGYIRMYEEGEERCQCNDCIAMDKLKADIDAIFTRVPIDMPFDPLPPKSHARRLHDAKVLENAQRLKNIEERESSYGKVVEITGPVVCKDGTKFEDYSWEQHLKYLGYEVPKDE